jgi:hypothetical protein
MQAQSPVSLHALPSASEPLCTEQQGAVTVKAHFILASLHCETRMNVSDGLPGAVRLDLIGPAHMH